MRSAGVLVSVMGAIVHLPLAQTGPERDPLVEHKTFAAPAALLFRYAFEIFQYAPLEVVDLAKSLRQQIGAGLLAPDATGAEHRDLPTPGGIEMARGKILELAKALDAGIDRAFERAHRHLKFVSYIDDERVGGCDQRIPVGWIDVGADLLRRIGGGVAERDDLLLQPDLQPLKRHR